MITLPYCALFNFIHMASKRSRSFCVWHITYTETDKSTLAPPDVFKEALQNLEPAGYIFQHEKGKIAGKNHYQCNLRLKAPMTMTDLRKALRSKLRNHWAAHCCTLRVTHDMKKADFYCLKEDTRVAGPWLFPSDIYIGQDLIKKFYPWQEYIFSILMGTPDDRKIHLICDTGGNKGKSLFAKTLGYRHDACVIPLGLTSAQMKSAIVSDGPHKIYILDLPRNNKSFQEIFDTIEELKRGFVISSFQGKLKKLYMNRPHVVCFTNEFPRLELLSFDMWDLYQISHDMGLERVDKLQIQRHQNQNNKNNNKIPVLSSLVTL